MKPMMDEIAELRRASVDELVTRYEALYGTPPRRRLKAWLWRRCAWKLQEQRFGGLSNVAKARLEQLISEIQIPIDEPGMTVTGRRKELPRARGLAPGTVLTREWQGQTIHVEALEDGFTWNGERYRSLSAVAKAATGSHWNGRLFFGLTGRKGGRA